MGSLHGEATGPRRSEPVTRTLGRDRRRRHVFDHPLWKTHELEDGRNRRRKAVPVADPDPPPPPHDDVVCPAQGEAIWIAASAGIPGRSGGCAGGEGQPGRISASKVVAYSSAESSSPSSLTSTVKSQPAP